MATDEELQHAVDQLCKALVILMYVMVISVLSVVIAVIYHFSH